MTDILVRRQYSEQQVKLADVKRAEFRPSCATSRVSNLLDQTDLGKTILLCEDHVRQFATPEVLRKYGYRKMMDYPFVLGNCDYCKVNGRAQMFMREDLFAEVWRTRDQQRRDREYAAICSG